MGKNCKKAAFLAIKTILLLVCIGFFAKSALEIWKQYHSGLKTMTTNVHANSEGLDLPAFLICNQSGFKNEDVNTRLADYKANTLSLEDLEIHIEGSFDGKDVSNVSYSIEAIHSAYKERKNTR